MAVLRLFASAREAAGTTRAEFDGPTVGDVLNAAVGAWGEGFAAVLGSSKVWVNGEEAPRDRCVGEADEVAVLPPVSGGMGEGEVPPTLAAVRAERTALQHEEDVVSFVRRLAQGRLDIVADTRRRRGSGGATGEAPLAERLAEVFGQTHGGGSARPPRETDVPSDHPLLLQLDELCASHGFESLDTLDDAALAALDDALAMFERECGRMRHEMFVRIDELTAEVVRRVREGGGAGAVIGDRPTG